MGETVAVTDERTPRAGDDAVTAAAASGHRWLVAPAAVALVLRSVAAALFLTPPTADGWSYLQRGLNLVATGVYGVRPGAPDATWPPLYSLLIAAVSWMPSPLAGVAVLQVLLGTISVVLIALIARALWGDRAALAAGMFAAFEPRLVLMPCLVLSENLFLPLLLLFAWLTVRAAQQPRALAPAAWAGVAAGLFTLTRSIGYLMPWIWLPAALVSGKRLRTLAAELGLVLALQHAVLLPWGVRNQVTLDHFSLLTSTGGSDLFLGNNPRATGTWYLATAEEIAKSAPASLGRKGFERERALEDAARYWIARHPLRAARLYVRKLRLMFDADRSVGEMIFEEQKQPEQLTRRTAAPDPEAAPPAGGAVARAILVAGFVLTAALQLCALSLAARGWRRSLGDRLGVTVLLGGALYLVLLAAVFLGDPRFRWPAQDLLLPLVGLLATTFPRPGRVMDHLPQDRRRRRWCRLWGR